jgi:hypothetical protein
VGAVRRVRGRARGLVLWELGVLGVGWRVERGAALAHTPCTCHSPGSQSPTRRHSPPHTLPPPPHPPPTHPPSYDPDLERILRGRPRRGRHFPLMAVIPPGLDFSNLKVDCPPDPWAQLAGTARACGVGGNGGPAASRRSSVVGAAREALLEVGGVAGARGGRKGLRVGGRWAAQLLSSMYVAGPVRPQPSCTATLPPPSPARPAVDAARARVAPEARRPRAAAGPRVTRALAAGARAGGRRRRRGGLTLPAGRATA